jgi:MerR family redox-sensitive transcriptional activator SoxR
MTIGELARRVGLEASAVRYYEREGILPRPERRSGRRDYTDRDLDLLVLARFAREAGFSIREVKALFGDRVAGEPVSARWSKLANAKIAELDSQVQRLRGMQELLRGVLRCACVEPETCGRKIRQRLQRGSARR